jgi:hypothetical protein
MSNRLRTEGTDHLLAAGRAVGARRFRGAEHCGASIHPHGRAGAGRADPLDPDAPAAFRPGFAAILHVEQAVTTIEWGEGLVLRYGGFYCPGTGISLAPDAPARGRSSHRLVVASRQSQVLRGGPCRASWPDVARGAFLRWGRLRGGRSTSVLGSGRRYGFRRPAPPTRSGDAPSSPCFRSASRELLRALKERAVTRTRCAP